KLQQQATVEIEPESVLIDFTRWVPITAPLVPHKRLNYSLIDADTLKIAASSGECRFNTFSSRRYGVRKVGDGLPRVMAPPRNQNRPRHSAQIKCARRERPGSSPARSAQRRWRTRQLGRRVRSNRASGCWP